MNAPPFNPGPAPSGGREEYGTQDGARRLAHMIAEAWRKVGVQIQPEIEGTARSSDGRTVYSVRLPQLVNGLPRR
jgi:hypothetical protein